MPSFSAIKGRFFSLSIKVAGNLLGLNEICKETWHVGRGSGQDFGLSSNAGSVCLGPVLDMIVLSCRD